MVIEVLSCAGGRIRLRVPWLHGSPHLAHDAAERVEALAGLRGVQVHDRTGCVVVWAGADLDPDELTALFADPPAAHPAGSTDAPSRAVAQRHGPHASTGEVARLIVGGAALAVVAFAKVVLRRPAAVSGRSADVLATVAVFTGMPFFRGAVRTLAGRPGNGTNLLVTAATAASLILRQNVVALTVLWLLNVGEFLQELTLRRTRRAIEHLLSIGEDRVWLVVDGAQVEVATDTLVRGDVVAVYAHHKIPVDGEVIGGDALVQQAAVTGEALPVVVGPGARVYAGTLVTDGSIHVRATEVGRDTVVGRIIVRVEQAQADRAPVQTVATRFTRRFVPVSFATAALTYLLTRDARRAITMLLVACPCAAGLSTPTAISAAIGNGARRGALIKGGAHLENAGRVSAVVFDKTGTLTLGRPLVTDVVALCDMFTTEQILALAASGEIHARHPLAQAVIRHTEEQHIEIPLHTQCEVVLGMGMRADLAGNRLLVGSPTLMRKDGVELTADAHQWVARLRAESKTVLCIAHNGVLVGVLGVADAIRSDSARVLDRLRALGVARVVMLTGDAEEAAAAVAGALGITEYVANALPEHKLEVVRTLQAQGHLVAMVGDGTNDAPALALADISMAMGSHASDVAIETADVALVGSDLGNVASVVQLSRRTMTVIRQNYGLSIGVNILGLLAGAGGTLSPVLAAVLHNASSVAVVANSARLIRYEPRPTPDIRPRPGEGHVPLPYDGADRSTAETGNRRG